MVLYIFDLFVLAGKLIFGSLGINSFVIFESVIGELIYFALFILTILAAHFVERIYETVIFVATIAMAIVFGGVYLALLTVLIIGPWILLIRWFTGAPDYVKEEEIEIELPQKEPKYYMPTYYRQKQQEYVPHVERKSVTEKYSFFKKN